MIRVAVLDQDRCRPDDCGMVCYKFCPKVRSNVYAIEFKEGEKKPTIVENLCIGCGICIKKCPFSAIYIVNLPDELAGEPSHRFGSNTFELFRLPVPQEGAVTGLLGRNGIGKTTVIKILAGEIKPNLGRYDKPPSWQEITRYYRGSVIQEFFNRLSQGKLKVVHKPQYVDALPKAVSGNVKKLLEKADERGKLNTIAEQLQLTTAFSRNLDQLSGGELQRVAIAAAMCREADVYFFDEPSSYLDVKQRLQVAKAIRSLKDEGKTVFVAEHDLAVLDYLSDQVCVLYGEPGIYGVVSHPHGVRVGINIYLEGYIADENVRFRETPIKFPLHPPATAWAAHKVVLKWKAMEKTYDGFTLTTKHGEIHQGEVIGILGPNGIGKTTFIKLLAGIEKPDKGTPPRDDKKVSYKPQYIAPEYDGTVESLLRTVAKNEYGSSWFKSELVQPLNIQRLLDRQVKELSGGELQRVAITACLARESLIYLLDEPSAYLDVEERLAMARTIRRIVESKGVTAFVVEHDVVAEDFIADRLMVFTGEPGIEGHANQPVSLRDGMNAFLEDMAVTFRRDPTTRRPRVNKEGSRLDKHQKDIGEYYYTTISEKEQE